MAWTSPSNVTSPKPPLSAILWLSAFLAMAVDGVAQTPSPDLGHLERFSRAVKTRYDSIKRDVVEAAEAVPESEYAFRPTSQVRTFGEIVGHIVDSQLFFCGVADGANPEYTDTHERSTHGKTALLRALKDSVARCDQVYARTDANNALDLVQAGKGDALRGMMLIDNVSHDNEHYGNLVTYMRLKGHVPPSTARSGQ